MTTRTHSQILFLERLALQEKRYAEWLSSLEGRENLLEILLLAGARVIEYNQGYRIYLGRGAL